MHNFLIGTRKGEELKAPRHASAVTTRDDRLPYSRHLLRGYYLLSYSYSALYRVKA